MSTLWAFRPPVDIRPYWLPVALALVGGAISLALTGFDFGISNNVFHIPYVLSLASQPEFKDDVFYSTLGNFTSVVWPLLRPLSTEANVRDVFLGAHVASRVGAILGLAMLLRGNGLASPAALATAVAVVVLSPWLQGTSGIGAHGLFINYFTHSEATWGFVFLAIAFLQSRRLKSSAAMVGVTFSINAFIGIWLFIVLTMATVFDRHSIARREFAGALVVLAAICLPVAAWIAGAVGGSGGVVDFSYIGYIRAYYPQHFLIETASSRALAGFVLLALAGVLAAAHLPRPRFWIGAQFGCLAIFAVGVPLPYLFDNRFIFNLCLLRSDGFGHAFAIVLMAVAGTRLALGPATSSGRAMGVICLGCLLAPARSLLDLAIAVLALAAALQDLRVNNGRLGPAAIRLRNVASVAALASFGALMAFRVLQDSVGSAGVANAGRLAIAGGLALLLWRNNTGMLRPSPRLTGAAIILAGLVIGAAGLGERLQQASKLSPYRDAWQVFVTLIREAGPPGPYLIPLGGQYDTFQLNARRKVWVDWKQGAAVMWSPQFHRQWASRYAEATGLTTPDDFIDYARRNRIRNVVIESDRVHGCPTPARQSLRTGIYALCVLDDEAFY